MTKPKYLFIIAIIMIIALLTSCSQESTITCNACGATISSDAKFCSECGANLAADTTLAPEGTQATDSTSEYEENQTSETPTVSETTEAPHTHDWSDWTATLDATCAAAGKQERSCSCGEKESQSISALAHTEVIDQSVAATCEKEGTTEGKHCSVCGVVTVKQETISALEHNYVDRVCTVCGHFGGSQGLRYLLSDDKAYYIVAGLGTCTDEDIYIPSSYKGKPVTSIGDGAFYGCTSLASITIPDSVTSIGTSAFYGCTNLKVSIINNPECSINYDAFPSNTVLVSEYNSAVHTLVKNSIGWNNYILISFDEYYSGCKNIDFVLSDDGKYYTVTGIGQCKDSHVVIPCFYNNLPVKAIANRAFYNCTTIKEITIPKTVTSIGTQIFYKASNLHTVYYNSAYSSSDNPFMNIANITKVVFDDETVPSYILENCTHIKEIIIGDHISSIGSNAFSGCSSLESVYITDIANWCEISFYDYPLEHAKNLYLNNQLLTEVVIPDSVTKINSYAFRYCTSLTSVTIGNSVTSIGSSAFEDCTSLASVTIGDSVTSVGEYAFYNCSSLTSIAIPDSVTSIDNRTFYGCTSLTSIIIPNSVTIIGDYAFKNCKKLTSVTIPGSVTSIGDDAFYGCTSLASITIPDSVTSIGKYAFSGCTSLASVTIPDSVTSIDGYAFSGCTSLASITIPESVTSIGNYAFYGCTSLTSITIPDSVTSIGNSAFNKCSSLKDVYYTGTEMEWQAISIGTKNEYLLNATIHYNSKN